MNERKDKLEKNLKDDSKLCCDLEKLKRKESSIEIDKREFDNFIEKSDK